ncbi:MAG: coenzyme F420-0:L-glutamate ligase [Thermaerobacter sp.]|nr:coenzyme F420-0:L-glutamate ligase [Thermaerobacter sp.]
MAAGQERGQPPAGTGQWVEKPARAVLGQRYRRFVIRTHLIRAGERLTETLIPYLKGRVRPDDIVVLGEKAVAIAEGRAVLLQSIKPRRAARFLSRQVRPLGYGLGLRRPETMEMAIREAGLGRILLAAAVGAADRLLGRSGDFYRIAGRRVASIDGPGPTTIPPYHQYIVLAPTHPEILANELSRRLEAAVAVVDVNDVGSEVLAASAGIDGHLVAELLRDNPMGQGSQRTPIGVLRPVPDMPPQALWLRVPAGKADGGMMLPMPGAGDACPLWTVDQTATTDAGSPPPG